MAMSDADSDQQPGSSEEEEEDDSQAEDGSSEEEDSDQPPTPRVELPDRDTRGKRMGRLMEDEGSADEDFWQQQFFAEERKDEEYEESTEEEDVPDADFSEAETDESETEKDVDDREPKKPKLKPPGVTKRKPPPGPSQPKAAKRPKPAASPPDPGYIPDAPTLRQSTKQRTEDAELMRLYSEQAKPRRKQTHHEVRQLTQRQLLAEAAATEIANTKSLQVLEAMEEEIKRRSAVKSARYVGPVVRTRSRQVDGAALTTVEVMNMLVPPELQAMHAPAPALRSACAVTGLPARYRDPATGLPYHDLAAYQVLRAHYGRR